MGHLNIRSIASKTEQLEQLLTNSNFDLLCLSETWLTESSPNTAYLVPGYKVFRKDRKFGKGGGKKKSRKGPNEEICFKIFFKSA